MEKNQSPPLNPVNDDPMDFIRAKGPSLAADGAYGVSPLRTLYRYYRVSQEIGKHATHSVQKESDMKPLEMEVKIDLRFDDLNGPMLLDTNAAFAAEHPLGSKGCISQEIRDKMKALALSNRYIDDPHWTTERGLAILNAIDELTFRLILAQSRICYLEGRPRHPAPMKTHGLLPVADADLGDEFLECIIMAEEGQVDEVDQPTVVG